MLGAEEGVSCDRGEEEVWPELESLHTSCLQTRLRSRVPMVMRLAPPVLPPPPLPGFLGRCAQASPGPAQGGQ